MEGLPALNLKKQLAFFLKERQLTGAELARRSGVPKQSISDWLAGVSPRNIAQVKKIADTLGVELTELCFGQQPVTGSPEKRGCAEAAAPIEAAADLIVSNTNELVVYCDPDGTIRKVSRRWAELLGWSQTELVGRNALGMVHPEDLPRLCEAARAHGTDAPGMAGPAIRVGDSRGRYVQVKHCFRVLCEGGPVLAVSELLD